MHNNWSVLILFATRTHINILLPLFFISDIKRYKCHLLNIHLIMLLNKFRIKSLIIIIFHWLIKSFD